MKRSRHYKAERNDRENCIKRYIGYGNVVAKFIVDHGHPKGPEVHKITDTGIILVYNKKSYRLITKLIARPGQIKRYYENGDAPQELLDVAYYNTVVMHYNDL